MSDSLLDEALRFCASELDRMRDTPRFRELEPRFGLLQRASWSLALLPATEAQVVRLAAQILALRDDVARSVAEHDTAGGAHDGRRASTELVRNGCAW